LLQLRLSISALVSLEVQHLDAMRAADLYTSAAHIRDAYEDLQVAWQEAASSWNDGVSRRFCEAHLEPMAAVVKQALESMARMTTLVGEMHRVCDD
jgi:hypothetical protein